MAHTHTKFYIPNYPYLIKSPDPLHLQVASGYLAMEDSGCIAKGVRDNGRNRPLAA
jgi:hypothetical protein